MSARAKAAARVAAVATLLSGILGAGIAPDADAHGHRGGYAGHGYVGGHGGRAHHYRHRHGGHRRWGGGVHFSWVAPLYVAPPWPRTTVVVPAAPAYPPYWSSRTVVVPPGPLYAPPVGASPALPDMPQLYYYPREEQDEARQNADRQECERWAWRQTRPDPRSGAVRTTRTVRAVPVDPYGAGPLPPAAGGAALGALGGAIAGDAGVGAAIGAAVGAASWLLGASAGPPRAYEQEVVVTEYVPAGGPNPDDLRRALTACMEGRGYTVR